MQTLNLSGVTANEGHQVDPQPETETSDERDTLLATTNARTDAHIFDAFNSGQIVLTDLDVFTTVKEQFLAYRDAPVEPARSTRELRANITGQLLRWRFGGNVGAAGRTV